jgi:hypothetical protein
MYQLMNNNPISLDNIVFSIKKTGIKLIPVYDIRFSLALRDNMRSDFRDKRIC